MIVGIGNDLIEIERIRRGCEKESFLRHLYTEEERKRFGNDPVKLAGNFAAKEAVAKSFGTGFSGFCPVELEILRDGAGKPYVNLYGGARKIGRESGITKIHITISNTKDYAMATAVAEG